MAIQVNPSQAGVPGNGVVDSAAPGVGLIGQANYVWNTGSLTWVAETQPGGGGGGSNPAAGAVGLVAPGYADVSGWIVGGNTVYTSTTNPLPVQLIGSTGGNAAAGLTGSAVPTYADYSGWNNGGNLTGTSLTTGLPIQPGTGTTWSVAQSGTWTVQQGTPPWTVAPDGTLWSKTGTSANVNVTNTVPVSGTVTANAGSGTFTVAGTVTSNQGTSPWVENVSQFGGNNVVTGTGVSGVGIPRVTVSSDSFPATQTVTGSVSVSNFPATQAVSGTVAVSNFPATQPVSGTVNIGNTVTVTGSLATSPSSQPQPVYLDDNNVPLDDNGYQLVNTNWDGSDVSTQTQQFLQTAALQQLAAGVTATIANPVTSVAVNNQPSNPSQENAGQLQRIADTMELILLELRTLNAVTASLAQPVPDDPDRIRTDFNITLQ